MIEWLIYGVLFAAGIIGAAVLLLVAILLLQSSFIFSKFILGHTKTISAIVITLTIYGLVTYLRIFEVIT